MKKIYSLLATALLALPAAWGQTADETIFSYAPADATDIQAIGWGRYVDNDVAIRLNNPAYVGYEVVGISVDIPTVAGCEVDPIGRAWLTNELYVAPNYVNVPDIGDPEGVPGEVKNVGTEENPVYRLDITFPEPYVIPAEGVYVGYTLKVTKLANWTQKYPVSITPSANPEGGLYMHSGYDTNSTTPALPRHKAWQNLAMSNHAVSTMRVILRGHKLSHGGVIVPQTSVYGENGADKPINAIFHNYGTENVTSVEYTITLTAEELLAHDNTTKTVTFPTPVGPDEEYAFTIPFTIPSERGNYTGIITADKINGELNLYQEKTSVFSLTARPWIPRKRVLVEEYTGFWCGYCPELYVNIKQAQDSRHDDFICVTIHKGDALTALESTDMPSPYAQAPSAQFDRGSYLQLEAELVNGIDQCLDQLAPADIDVELYWTDDSKTALRPEAKVHFLDAAEPDQYKLTYALVEDNMSDPSWNQRNFFWDASAFTADYYKGPYWDLFIGKPYETPGIVYDDVALLYGNCFGIPGSLPDAIPADGTATHHIEMALSSVKCYYGEATGKSVIKNPDNLRVVALLLDSKTGRCVNVNTSKYAKDALVYDETIVGVEKVELSDDSAVVAEEYYTFDGMRLAHCPDKGAVIIVKRLANGQIKTAKRLQ